MRSAKRILVLFIVLSMLLLPACGQKGDDSADAVITPQATPYPEEYSVYAAPYLPVALLDLAAELPMVAIADSADGADLLLDVSSGEADISWVYTLAAPFWYIGKGVTSVELQAFWSGADMADFPADQLFVNGSTLAVFEKVWGTPDADRVTAVSGNRLLARTGEQESAFALLPFESLGPAWQVLEVDGVSPIRKDFDPSAYALTVPFSFIGDTGTLLGFNFRMAEKQVAEGYLTNWRADRLTTVIMTGVTALVRDTAFIIENKGYTYPAIDIGDTLREADILHINNEVPFAESCPNPFANPDNDANLIFCSKPEYIQLLEAIGTDVVELAGDHFWNWGDAGMYLTLDMYDERGWQYYGGGRDMADAIEPALFEHNGNKIAFIGCNAKPPGYKTTTEDSPGAAPCDMDVMGQQVKDVIADGYLPIFTFQHTEYYNYGISPSLQEDFRQMADAGAVIVQGSQAHHPHGMEFYKNAFIHYGLGNLFFDQYYESFETRQAFLDRHVFYDGKYISTELIPIMFIDNARSRLMTENERENLLSYVFAASGW